MRRLIILLSIVGVAIAACGRNEVQKECATACPLTCSNLRNPPPDPCPTACVPRGCECEDGYVYTDQGRCVLPELCPPERVEVCGYNQHFSACGTGCPLTCDNMFSPQETCAKNCVSGCQCNAGFVLIEDGTRCVLPRQCPQKKCGRYQQFLRCGSACPMTCENYPTPPTCAKKCVTDCFCVKGFVMTAEKKCVKPIACPPGNASADTEASSTSTQCLEKPDPGVCDAYFPKWYYDPETNSCHLFVYGGCGGNGNRFESEEECLHFCQASESEEE